MQKLDSFQIHVDDGKPKKHKPRYFETQNEEIYTIDAKKNKKMEERTFVEKTIGRKERKLAEKKKER